MLDNQQREAICSKWYILVTPVPYFELKNMSTRGQDWVGWESYLKHTYNCMTKNSKCIDIALFTVHTPCIISRKTWTLYCKECIIYCQFNRADLAVGYFLYLLQIKLSVTNSGNISIKLFTFNKIIRKLCLLNYTHVPRIFLPWIMKEFLIIFVIIWILRPSCPLI